MKMNTLTILLVVLLLLAPIGLVFAAARMHKNLFLVLDSTPQDQMVASRFRKNNDMRVSASGQFSEPEFKELLSKLPVKADKVWVIDLRQESHGFIDGVPVSWYSTKNQANIHKTSSEIIQTEKNLLDEISKQDLITVYTVRKLGGGEIKADKPIKITPKIIESEKDLVNKMGVNYERLYILDHHKPADFEIDNFVNFIKDTKKQDRWVHFHCRGGKGRSSTFMAMYEILLHAKDKSFDEIMRHQIDMGNSKLSENSQDEGKAWKQHAATDRYDFLRKFYEYARSENGYLKSNWSLWATNSSINK